MPWLHLACMHQVTSEFQPTSARPPQWPLIGERSTSCLKLLDSPLYLSDDIVPEPEAVLSILQCVLNDFHSQSRVVSDLLAASEEYQKDRDSQELHIVSLERELSAAREQAARSLKDLKDVSQRDSQTKASHAQELKDLNNTVKRMRLGSKEADDLMASKDAQLRTALAAVSKAQEVAYNQVDSEKKALLQKLGKCEASVQSKERDCERLSALIEELTTQLSNEKARAVEKICALELSLLSLHLILCRNAPWPEPQRWKRAWRSETRRSLV